MKYYPRLNVYKASNVKVDPETLKSWSYDWWCFSKMIYGRLVFNLGTYSATTTQHQYKARDVLRSIHGEPDLYVFTRQCLDRVSIQDLARDTAMEYATDFVARMFSKDPCRDLSWRASKARDAVFILAPLSAHEILNEAIGRAKTERRARLDAARARRARRAAKRLQESSPRLRLVTD